MKCTSKLLFSGILIFSLLTCGCSSDVAIDDPYDISVSATNASSEALTDFSGSSASIHYFAEDLCVAPKEQTHSDAVTDEVVEAMGVFLPADGTISYQKNIYKKMYPASTTKILTAYLAITQANPDDTVTISEHAADQARVHYKVQSDSSLQIHPHRISLSGHCFLSYYFPLTFCLLCCLKSANRLSECSINIIQNPQPFFKHVCIRFMWNFTLI